MPPYPPPRSRQSEQHVLSHVRAALKRQIELPLTQCAHDLPKLAPIIREWLEIFILSFPGEICFNEVIDQSGPGENLRRIWPCEKRCLCAWKNRAKLRQARHRENHVADIPQLHHQYSLHGANAAA